MVAGRDTVVSETLGMEDRDSGTGTTKAAADVVVEAEAPEAADDHSHAVATDDKLARIDTAKVDPCPGCGVPVRRFSSTPISGTGLDLHFSGPWWCDWCIKHGVATGMRRAIIVLLGRQI